MDEYRLIKKCTHPGSNRGPLACEANVITNYTMSATIYYWWIYIFMRVITFIFKSNNLSINHGALLVRDLALSRSLWTFNVILCIFWTTFPNLISKADNFRFIYFSRRTWPWMMGSNRLWHNVLTREIAVMEEEESISSKMEKDWMDLDDILAYLMAMTSCDLMTLIF